MCQSTDACDISFANGQLWLATRGNFHPSGKNPTARSQLIYVCWNGIAFQTSRYGSGKLPNFNPRRIVALVLREKEITAPALPAHVVNVSLRR